MGKKSPKGKGNVRGRLGKGKRVEGINMGKNKAGREGQAQQGVSSSSSWGRA